jgi:hypothetical protein
MSIKVSSAPSAERYTAVAASKRHALDDPAAANPVRSVDKVSIAQTAARLAATSAIRSAPSPTGADGATSSHDDYTNMTPAQMKTAAQGMYDAGKIDLTELFKLQTAGMPLGKAGPNGEFVQLTEAEKAAASAEPVNYLQTFKDGISFLEQTGYATDSKSGYAQMKHILETLQSSQA